jgi:two-component system, NarL family, response regulator LiaR
MVLTPSHVRVCEVLRDLLPLGLRAELTGAEQSEPWDVLIADDDDGFLELASTLVANDGRFEVIGHARDGSEAVDLAFELHPDIVLMDVVMPIVDGVEATQTILALHPHTTVIAISGIEESELALAARIAGAVDYVQKARADEELIDAMLAAIA